jgi:hypothetical protein
MIRVSLPTPPSYYETAIRQPGLAFLSATPNPRGIEWNQHRYWTRSHGFLYKWHKGICVYCASWTPRRARASGIDHTSIDHFVPKSKDPKNAYTWGNFRLARSKLNNRKSDFEDVIDPCCLQAGWFRLSFTTFFVHADLSSPPEIQNRVKCTIERLLLNRDSAYVNERARVVYRYAAGNISFGDVQRLYPFIAQEMTIQKFDVTLKHSILAALVKRPWLAH